MDISIIIATHNCEKYIGRVLRSALDQTFDKSNYEVIVIDDGSTDSTCKILDSFKDRIKIFTLEENMGLSYARNYGIKNALGKFIVCVDADDYISRNLLQIEYLYLLYNDYIDAVSCDYFIVDEDEKVVRRMDAVMHPIACGIMFYKDKIKDIGLYDEDFRILEDLDLRKRYLENFNIYNIPLPLYRYRDHSRNLTKKREKIIYYRKKLFKKHRINNIGRYFKNHKNVKAGLDKC